ncbi:uncharacterized protein [Branchiostoma lanceolatum]|uniref:uncharacterized protein n=1 Tax=Branchiostoma lanceolatum TaxID=7740 RepID=UPI0034556D3B
MPGRWRLFLGLLACFLPQGRAALPPGCTVLEDQTFSTADVSGIFGVNRILATEAPPQRVGTLRDQGPLPTGHFATNQIKPHTAPMRLFPYSAVLSREGITYDAYTLDRWNATVRSDEMMQQTPSRQGAPWDKVVSVGTNMKQMVSGPDGAPKAAFTGNSGVRVGIEGSGEPVMTSVGQLHANFLFSNGEGSMEVPLVRGAPFLTHLFNAADPVLAPYCLSAVDGVDTDFRCPTETSAADGGSGFGEATCSGGNLELILHVTKAVDDMSQVQWAAEPAGAFSGNMHSCDTATCRMDDDGRTVRVKPSLSNVGGTMAYAFNVVGRFVVPWGDWNANPLTVSCSRKREAESRLQPAPRALCAEQICLYPSCQPLGGGQQQFQLTMDFGTQVSYMEEIQVAVDTADRWPSTHVMLTCNPTRCTLSPDGLTVTYTATVPQGQLAYAINRIGFFVSPAGFWIDNPHYYTCDGSGELSSYVKGSQTTTTATTASTTRPTSGTTTTRPTGGTTTTPPVVPPGPVSSGELSACTETICRTPSCADIGGGFQRFTLVLQFSEPLGGINEIQVAANTKDAWDNSHPMVTCTGDTCSLSSDGRTLQYVSNFPEGVVYYAIHRVGKFVDPPTFWDTQPYEYQCGGGGAVLSGGKSFVLELDEPGNKLNHRTRKFVAYFSEEMTLSVDANGAKFSPSRGGKFTGSMQLVYVGSTARGDLDGARVLDQYAGVYPYRPDVTSCASGNSGYINFRWNKRGGDFFGSNPREDLLMIAVPHQEELLAAHGTLVSTPFTFKGYVGDEWLMEEPLPPAGMDPDPVAVSQIRNDPAKLQVILDAIRTDSSSVALDAVCTQSNSYGVGKDIAMVTRLASISRAFETNHYHQLDEKIRRCLEKWLRIDDSLSAANKLEYDPVWGGLFIGSSDPNNFDPHANFGFPMYSDHHFHLGYFLYALGYYVKYHNHWAHAGDHMARIVSVARDVGNPSTLDPHFPVVRHKDWYLGMSWATGIVGGARQAESSTEAINCYHGLAALGEALGDDVMKQVGQITLATEIRSVRHYWHVRNYNRHIFPEYIKTYGTIGQFAEDAIFYYTLNWPCWPYEFPMRHACLVGIQVIPIISVSNLYMDQEWGRSVQDVCDWAVNPWNAPGAGDVDPSILQPVQKGWGAFCHAAASKADAAAETAAADYVRQLSTGELVGGTGLASTLLFIYGST